MRLFNSRQIISNVHFFRISICRRWSAIDREFIFRFFYFPVSIAFTDSFDQCQCKFMFGKMATKKKDKENEMRFVFARINLKIETSFVGRRCRFCFSIRNENAFRPTQMFLSFPLNRTTSSIFLPVDQEKDIKKKMKWKNCLQLHKMDCLFPIYSLPIGTRVFFSLFAFGCLRSFAMHSFIGILQWTFVFSVAFCVSATRSSSTERDTERRMTNKVDKERRVKFAMRSTVWFLNEFFHSFFLSSTTHCSDACSDDLR